MKFVSEHPCTRELLREWGGKDVVVAKFFFWRAGGQLEKSQKGLLRSLLYQILHRHPELVPDIVFNRHNADAFMIEHPRSWTCAELSAALKAILLSSRSEFRFCFFIDGLDEFEGDYYDLVEDLDRLASSSAVKLCVSSRPWTVFQTTYGFFTDRQFSLQDLTSSDITKYIRGSLEEDGRFLRLFKTKSEASKLIDKMQGRAEGVFLWVTLAVKSLRRGLGQRDNVRVLEARIDGFPAELNTFIQRIFDSVEPVYQSYLARALVLHLHSLTHFVDMSALALCFLEEEASSSHFAMDAPIRPLSRGELFQRMEQAQALISNWGKDLLYIDLPTTRSLFGPDERPHILTVCQESQIGFLHATIYDFLFGKLEDGTLGRMAGEDFDPLETSVRLRLRLIKYESRTGRLDHLIDLAMNLIGHVERKSRRSQMELIKEVNRVHRSLLQDPESCSRVFRLLEQEGEENFRLVISGWAESQPQDVANSDLLSYALFWGLDLSFRNEYKQMSHLYTQAHLQRFLEYACVPLRRHEPSDEDVVARLTGQGADLNLPMSRKSGPHYSVWQRYLVNFLNRLTLWGPSWTPGDVTYWLDPKIKTMDLMLQYGADPGAHIDIREWIDSPEDVKRDGETEYLSAPNLSGTKFVSVITAFEEVAPEPVLAQYHAKIEDMLKKASEAKRARR